MKSKTEAKNTTKKKTAKKTATKTAAPPKALPAGRLFTGNPLQRDLRCQIAAGCC